MEPKSTDIVATKLTITESDQASMIALGTKLDFVKGGRIKTTATDDPTNELFLLETTSNSSRIKMVGNIDVISREPTLDHLAVRLDQTGEVVIKGVPGNENATLSLSEFNKPNSVSISSGSGVSVGKGGSVSVRMTTEGTIEVRNSGKVRCEIDSQGNVKLRNNLNQPTVEIDSQNGTIRAKGGVIPW